MPLLPQRAAVLLTAAMTLLVLVRGQPEEDVESDALSSEQLRFLHKKFDQDSNGRVSLQEVMSYAQGMARRIAHRDTEAILDEIDTSKDGRLSLEEHLIDIRHQVDTGDEEEMKLIEERQTVEAAKHAAADLNKDGVLDGSELPALFYPELHEDVLSVAVADTMRQKDKDRDGKLSEEEFWALYDEAGGEAGELSEEEKRDFAQLDKDGSGFLSLDEIRDWESGHFHIETAMKMLFDLADKDHDLHVTADELVAARAEIGTSDAQYHLIEWVEHHEL